MVRPPPAPFRRSAGRLLLCSVPPRPARSARGCFIPLLAWQPLQASPETGQPADLSANPRWNLFLFSLYFFFRFNLFLYYFNSFSVSPALFLSFIVSLFSRPLISLFFLPLFLSSFGFFLSFVYLFLGLFGFSVPSFILFYLLFFFGPSKED